MEVGENNGDGLHAHAISVQADSISAQHVVKAAHEELLQLMRQRAEIMKRIGTVKQTIAGLANLFGVPEGTDGSAASAGSPRGLPGTGTIRSGHPGAAQGSAGLGHNRFESPGGL